MGIEEVKIDVLESVCGDVNEPKSFVGKDTRIAYVSLGQGYIGSEKWEKVRRRTSVSGKGEGHTRLLSNCNSGLKDTPPTPRMRNRARKAAGCEYSDGGGVIPCS